MLLVEAGIATHEQLRTAQTEGIANGERLGEVLLRKGWIDELAPVRDDVHVKAERNRESHRFALRT